MNANAIRPVAMKAIPKPRRPAGMSEYLSFSRTPANATIASAQPKPLPTPYTRLSAKS